MSGLSLPLGPNVTPSTYIILHRPCGFIVPPTPLWVDCPAHITSILSFVPPMYGSLFYSELSFMHYIYLNWLTSLLPIDTAIERMYKSCVHCSTFYWLTTSLITDTVMTICITLIICLRFLYYKYFFNI